MQSQLITLGSSGRTATAALRELACARHALLFHRKLCDPADWRAFNHEQLDHHSSTISWGEYWANADFWDRSLQNWQSEFLAIGTMAVFSVYFRQRGSPESKPVGAPHAANENQTRTVPGKDVCLCRRSLRATHDNG